MVAACILAEMIVVQHLKGVRLSAAPLAESQLTQRLLEQIIRRIGRLAWPRCGHELYGRESDSACWPPVAGRRSVRVGNPDWDLTRPCSWDSTSKEDTNEDGKASVAGHR